MSYSHRGFQNPPSTLPKLPLFSIEEPKSTTRGKVMQNINTRDLPTALSLRYPKSNILQQDTGYVPSPIEKQSSFSDIISPQNVQAVINMSLEKELEQNMRKSLNTMSENSDLFEESSIPKDITTPKADAQSAFDIKEHNSLLNDDLPQDAADQPNKKICILCHNSREVHKRITETEYSKSIENIGDYDLIYPCLCRIRTHRECMKSYILSKKVLACDRCKTKYAISGKKMNQINLAQRTFILMTLAALASIIISVAGLLLIASGFSGKIYLAVVGIILLFAGLSGISYLAWKKYFSKKIVDIAIYCKQTEIARHSDFSEYRFKKFVDCEESKKSSRILKRSRKILNFVDVTEFETFVKMTTPRIEKQEKIANHERSVSSNFLLSDHSKHKESEEEDLKKKARKEIFIGTTEVEKSENTVPDYPNNTNEYSAKLKHGPQIRITTSHPSKHAELRRNIPRPLRPDNRRQVLGEIQSERNHIDFAKRVQPSGDPRTLLKGPQNSTSTGHLHGFTTRDQIDSPDLLGLGLPRRYV